MSLILLIIFWQASLTSYVLLGELKINACVLLCWAKNISILQFGDMDRIYAKLKICKYRKYAKFLFVGSYLVYSGFGIALIVTLNRCDENHVFELFHEHFEF